ncbi:HEAT repeat domain-containing protein [Streptomyces sp. NPDC002308]
MEQRLARCVEADDSVARDQWARILADACGEEALPALLRAMATDRNDDGDTLQLNVLRLLDAWPDTSLRQALDLVASDAPGIRRVGLWCLSVLDFGGTRHFGRVAAAASDPEPEVRADVMDTLGSIFGTGDPSRARVLLMAGADDPAPEVRRSAVSALQAWHDVTVTGVLVTRSGDTDPWVRFAAAWSLARRPAPEARAALVRLTTDRHTDVREAAGTVLALGTEAASG